MTKLISDRNYCKETLQFIETISQSFLVLGERLHKIQSERLWETDYSSWEEWVEETKMSAGNISKLISVYETWILDCKVDPAKLSAIPYSTLYEMRKLLKSDNSNALQVVEESGGLMRKHIEDKVRDVEFPKCKHQNTSRIEICNDCHKSWKV